MIALKECERRKAGADGSPARLADGQVWLLAHPTYCSRARALTYPCVDTSIDLLFDKVALNDAVFVEDVWQVARILLKENYDITDDELVHLLRLSSATEYQDLVDSVLEALFGPENAKRQYTDWVRATLIANGLSSTVITTHDLQNVLAILVATNRTVHLSQFADTCRAANERCGLETLV